MTEIYTSFWSSPLLGDADAVMVGISRTEPRHALPYEHRSHPALAPSDKAWAEQETAAFAGAYGEQLRGLGAARILRDLDRIAGGKPAVLLCYERPTEFCHRRLVADFLREQAGIEAAELGPGMVRTRPDAAQPTLDLPRGDEA